MKQQDNQRARPSSLLPNLAIAAVIFVVMLILVEFGLRLFGYQPDIQFFRTVDQLEVYDYFATDADGIFKANPDSEYWVDKLTINADGFRSPDFTAATTDQCSVLLLGDSFAWGLSADPLEQAFPDLLRAQGYVVYNTGIPGTGPTQYERIAKRYVPVLKPDLVLLAFTMENDLMAGPQDIGPNQSLWHVTNAGWIIGLDEGGHYLSAQEAYDHYIGGTYASAKRLAYSSSLGTLLITAIKSARAQLRAPVDSAKQPTADEQQSASVKVYAYSFDTVARIADFSKTHGADFSLLTIPDLGEGCGEGKDTRIDSYREKLDTLGTMYLDGIPDDVFIPHPDCHVDNRGHRFIAERLLESIKACPTAIPSQ